MKESTGSLRAFFVIVGLLGIVGGGLGVLGSLALMAFSVLYGVILLVVCAASLLVSIAYVYCGAQLPTLLDTRAEFVVKVILAGLALNIASAIFGVIVGGGLSLGRTGFSVLISLYLLNSVKRLAAERAANPVSSDGDPGFSRFQ
ncbi:hypothetical protein IV102_19335 [bacterium]|nr:hypothetical protein [bacterium]